MLNLPAAWDEIVEKWKPTFKPRLAALYRVGSHSHGTHLPANDPMSVDDLDLMAVVIPPPEQVLGFREFDHAVVRDGPLDVVIYSWSKYLGMLLKSNPNVLGTLWLDPEDVWSTQTHPLSTLIQHRAIFASKDAHAHFCGYARGQLHKMTHQAFQGYMGAKRKTLVEQFGFDVKNAAHLIRLLRMCSEFLVDGQMVVRRPDHEEIVSIKRGEWSLERVGVEAQRLFALCDERLAASTLRDHPDVECAEQILIEACWSSWGRMYKRE